MAVNSLADFDRNLLISSGLLSDPLASKQAAAQKRKRKKNRTRADVIYFSRDLTFINRTILPLLQ